LSLGLNYPNQADKIRSKASDLGGDIFIHGSCVSIGCLAMTDESIKEIYTLAILARNSNQMKIPVIIAPFTMLQSKKMDFDKQADLKPYAKYFGLWKSIFEGISTFHKTKQLPKFTISKNDLLNGINIIELIADKTQVFPSKGEAKKMLQGGGVFINKLKIEEPTYLIESKHLIGDKYIIAQKGKKNYYLLIAE
jgi:murein L,D-transpeptidase YafK